MSKSLINTYNVPDTLVVLSSFPDMGRNSMSAIDRYTEQKFTDLSKNRKIIVCAEQTTSQNKTLKVEKPNILLARIWKKGSMISFFSLLRFLLSLNNTRTVFVEFEFNVYGGMIPNFMLLCVLFFLKISGKRVVFELHQVITDIAELSEHLNIHNPAKQRIFSFGIKQYYRSIGYVTTEIIVLEEELKKRLSKLVNQNKITVLPHHMSIQKTVDTREAKKLAGLPEDSFVVLVFGYLNWYKGVDWIAKAAKQWKGKKIQLLVAGGPNPYHKDKSYYQKYYQDFLATIKDQSNITYTGFVDEKNIGMYFSAADMCILPYRVLMAASGPFSLALSYGKPVILSEALSNYCESKDFKETMDETLVQKESLFFPLNDEALLTMVEKIKGDKNYYDKLCRFSNVLAQKRTGTYINSQLIDILFPSVQKSAEKRTIPKAPFAIPVSS